MTKHIALILVLVGTGLAAANGARNSDEMMARQRTEGQASLFAAARDHAFADYCAARIVAELPVADGCVDPDAAAAHEPAERDEDAQNVAPPAEPAPPTVAELATQRVRLVQTGRAELEQLRAASAAALPPAVKQARDAWIAAADAAIVPEASFKTQGPLSVDPVGRLEQWFSLAGLPFLGGIALVVLGALLARGAQSREMAATLKGSGANGPIDFGELIGQIRDAAAGLHERMAANGAPTQADFDQIKTEIEDVQLDQIERVVLARNQLQAVHGLAGFAAVFSPFSGAERSLNRAWSAIVDQHWPEATTSVARAAAGFGQAQDELAKLGSRAA